MTHARIVAHVVRWMVAVLTLLAAAEVATGAEVKGRVVDPQGEAVKGAKVFVIQTDAEGLEVLKDSATADGEGKFFFANVEERLGRPGQLVARAEGWGVGISSPQKGKPTEIRLTQPIEVTVPFVDEEGKPVRDLPVRTNLVSLGGSAGVRFTPYVRPPQHIAVDGADGWEWRIAAEGVPARREAVAGGR